MESILLSYYLRHPTSCPYLSSHHLFALTENVVGKKTPIIGVENRPCQSG